MKVFEILRKDVAAVSEQQVIDRIKNFDWKYEFSDDVSRITWGMRELELIENLVYQVYKQKPEVAVNIWNEYSPEATGDKSIIPSFILRLESQELKKPTLQEALGMDWVFNLNEVFDADFASMLWKKNKDTQVGTGKIGDETFEIMLEPGTFSIDDNAYNYINVAFIKIVNGKSTEKLQFNSKNASTIVGAVSNALLKQVKLYDFDAVIFMAIDNVADRMRIYNKVAERKWTSSGLGDVVKNIPIASGGMATALVSKEIARHQLEEFKKFVEHLEK